jgi:hypothetical protein
MDGANPLRLANRLTRRSIHRLVGWSWERPENTKTEPIEITTMGRTLKRVPMDFAWPQGKTWGGYLNPFSGQSTPCDQCGGTGSSPEANRLKDQWYGYAQFRPEDRGSKPLTIHTPKVRAFAERNCSHSPGYYGTDEKAVEREALRLITMWNAQWCHHLNADDVKALVEGGRLHDLTSTFTPGEGWKRNDPPNMPTPEEVNDWSIGGFGHDSINQWIVVGAECERMGYPKTCVKCEGEGTLWPSPEIQKQAEDWTDTEPPTGDGYQLWETTSEGSPSSPVFATIEELCAWCATGATTFGSSRATAEQWREMLDADFVCHREGNAIFI